MYTPSMILYSFASQDRSGKIRWLLRELNIPFELKLLNGEKLEHKDPQYLALSPMGVVPALIDGDKRLFESAAIALYLTEKAQKLAPPVDSRARADFLKWTVFASATLDPLLIKIFKTHDMSEEEKETHLSYLYAEFREPARQLEEILKDSNFVVGGEFSAADIMLAQPLNWAWKGGLLKNHPKLLAYLERLKGRPACIESEIFPAP